MANKIMDFINKINFKKNLKKEKSKIYTNIDYNENKFKTKRNKFKLFKNKLEFENTFSEIKKINIYYYIIGVFLILSSLYVLIFSHYFSLKTIDIIRQDELININMSYKSIENIRYKPILFINKDEVKNMILSHQPNIIDIYIRKILPNNLKIILKSRESIFLFNIDNKFYEITSNGVIIPSKEKIGIQKINIIGFDNLGIFEYKKMFKEEYIKKIKEILDKIIKKNSFIKLSEITYFKKERELHIINENKTIIIFDLNKDINAQIEKLNVFYKEYFKKINSGIVYIDLRINERVIFCDTKEEFQCKQNYKSIYK